MFISSGVLELAVANVLQGLEAKAGTAVEFRQLSQLWGQTGLRTSDLRDAVHELMERRLLRVVDNPAALSLMVTELGAARLLAPIAQTFDTGTLHSTQQRVLQPQAPRQQLRRHIDPVQEH